MEQKDFLTIKPADIEAIIKVNNLQEITDPIFFSSNNSPSPNGLLSNEIFGITMNDRANIVGYINLGGNYFLHPLFYSIWTKIDRNIANVVHGIGLYKLNNNNLIVPVEEGEDGETGIEFLRKNINIIKFKESNSFIHKTNVQFLEKFKKLMFIKNYLVIPPYYRDVTTQDKYVGVGDINKLYAKLIATTRSLKEYDRYGLTIYNAVNGRIQDILMEIYNYFTKGEFNGASTGSGLSGKQGIIHSAVQSKTTDFSSRLVISAPNLKVENIDDLTTDVDHANLPLASVIANYYPYMLTFVKQFLTNEYANNSIRTLTVTNSKTGKKHTTTVKIKDFRITFSDDKLKDEMDRFIHGIANRFRPIELPTTNKDYPVVNITLHGYYVTDKDLIDKSNASDESRMQIIERPMTWCDLFYLGAVEITKDKYVLITRYPIDSCYNQFPCGINVSSTIKTIPIVLNHKMYKHYPYIRKKDIGSNTTNKFIDVLNISNVYLGSIDGDYDGDQVTVKSVYSVEANAELKNQINSKRHFISLDGRNILNSSKECVMAIFSLTMNSGEKDKAKFTNPIF